MALYRYYLLSASGGQARCTRFNSDTDAQARKVALQMLRDYPDVERLEAWRDADLAFRLNRHTAISQSKAEQCSGPSIPR
jgi:hypothetical protein